MKQITVLTGAGISVESGLATFRGAGGLWEGYKIEEVATPEGWRKNPGLVLEFYNKRRAQARLAMPNPAHTALVQLEQKYKVAVVTQNVDDLHERAGSGHVMHLHGMLNQSRSTGYPSLIYDVPGDINLGDTCEKGSQLRPNIVWFGEAVPMIEKAAVEAGKADVFIVVGTSLQVYPAAGLVNEVKPGTPVYIIDPEAPETYSRGKLTVIKEMAGVAVPKLVNELLNGW